jgi:hypothetical protein
MPEEHWEQLKQLIIFSSNNPEPSYDSEDDMHGSYLGPEFSDMEINLDLKKQKAVVEKLIPFDALATKVAGLLPKVM